MLFPTGATIDWRPKKPISDVLTNAAWRFAIPLSERDIFSRLSVEALAELGLISHAALSRQVVRQSAASLDIRKTRASRLIRY